MEVGFNIDDEGCFIQVAEVENAKAGEEVLPEPKQELGRGCLKKKKATVPLGGVALWEHH